MSLKLPEKGWWTVGVDETLIDPVWCTGRGNQQQISEMCTRHIQNVIHYLRRKVPHDFDTDKELTTQSKTFDEWISIFQAKLVARFADGDDSPPRLKKFEKSVDERKARKTKIPTRVEVTPCGTERR